MRGLDGGIHGIPLYGTAMRSDRSSELGTCAPMVGREHCGRAKLYNGLGCSRPAFLGDLQARVGSCKNTWIEELHVKYESLPAPAPVEGQPPPAPVVVTKVVVTARFLFTEVPFDLKQHNAKVMSQHRSQLIDAVRKSPYVSSVPGDEIHVFADPAHSPKVTFTLVIQKDKAL